MVEIEKRTPESVKSKNIRSFEITDGEIIEPEGITHYKWLTCEPLLNALRTTRIQTESGEVQISPISYEKVRSLFPKGTRWTTIYNSLQMLNNSLAPSGWSILRQGEATKKPIDAPWFLRGPDDGAQNNEQPNPQQKTISNRTLGGEKREAALKQFDPLAYGDRLLLSFLTNVLHPEFEKNFTKDLCQFMSSCLPADLKLRDILGNKTPQECFQEIIKNSINSMAGKTYEELSEIQQKIMPRWNELKINSGQHPKIAISEHFSEHDSNKPLDQGNNDAGNSEEDIIKPKRTRG